MPDPTVNRPLPKKSKPKAKPFKIKDGEWGVRCVKCGVVKNGNKPAVWSNWTMAASAAWRHPTIH